MAVSFLNSRTMSVGPMRLITMRLTTGGASETISNLPVFASSTTRTRAMALTATPLTDGSADAVIRPTAVANERLTVTIDAGANGDQFVFRIWGG